MARNRFDVDETLEEPLNFKNLKKVMVYVFRYKGRMLSALLLSGIGSIVGLTGPMIIQYAMDYSIPEKNLNQLFQLAILLGMKREAIGATHSINRESNLALITDVYGPDSPEARGSLSIYVVGGMIGTIYFGFMVSVIAMLDIFHPYALGMASGVGAGILMASAVASLTEIFPAMADQISALASASETISGIDGIYMSLLIGLPLCNWLYKVLEPRIGRFGGKRRQEKAAAADAVEEKEEQK